MKKRFNIFLAMAIAFLIVGGISGAYKYRNNRIERILHGNQDVEKIPPDVKKHEIQVTPKIIPPIQIKTPILMYHYVEDVTDLRDTKRKSLNISPLIFETQIQTLQDSGYTFITPNELANIVHGNTRAPSKPIILSFDDGYQDFYTDVFPILKKYHAHAVIYVINSFVDYTRNFLTTNELEEISQSGLVEIGAHTVHHMWLKNLKSDVAEKEIQDSKTQLSQLLHMPIRSFAYPFGAFDSTTIDLVKKAGYTNAVSTVPGADQGEKNMFYLYRLRPGYRIGQTLLNYIANVKDARVNQVAPSEQ